MDDSEEKRIEKYKEKFEELLQQAEKDSCIGRQIESKIEENDIEIAEVLAVGHYGLAPEVVIVRDTKGKVWAIPEDNNNSTPLENQLVSRWDVRPGMKLRLKIKTITEEKICGVLIVK